MLQTRNLSDIDESVDEMFHVSDEVIVVYTWVVFAVMCQILNLFGIFTNIINTICFVKQGFQDSINISLLGLTISDLGSLTTTVGICISVTPAVLAADLPFEPMEACYLTAAMPHFSFTRVSSFITAMITLERCLCITAPLKIKSFFTPNRAAVITVLAFVIFFCSAIPVYVVNRLDFKFSWFRNKTILGLVAMEGRESVEKLSFSINNFAIPFVAFMIVVICTTVLSFQLKQTTQWRLKCSTRAQAERISGRNQKVAKMVVMISTLFIVCFVPNCITLLALAFVPALSVQGKYMNTTLIITGIGYTLECINSSMNIFIYYHMSSKYRDTFYKLFSCIKLNEQGLEK